MRIAPPTRGSTSQTGFVNPFGPHHSARCFASIHARNTNSGDAAIRLVRLTSSSPASSTLLFPMLSSLRLYLAQIILQLVEAAVPSTNVPIAVFIGYEERLVEVHRRLSVMLLERDRHHRLVTAQSSAFVPLKRVDQPLRRNHLPVLAALTQIELPQHAVARVEPIAMQTKPPPPTRPPVVLHMRRRKLTRPTPMLHMFRIGPHLPHQFARRIEHPRNMQLMLRSHPGRHRCCTHRIPPFVFADKRADRCSASRSSVCFPPSIEPYSRTFSSLASADAKTMRIVIRVFSPASSNVAVISNCAAGPPRLPPLSLYRSRSNGTTSVNMLL